MVVTVNCRNRLCGKVDVGITQKEDKESKKKKWVGLCPICGVEILAIDIKPKEEE